MSSEDSENGKLLFDNKSKKAKVQNRRPIQQKINFRCFGLNLTIEFMILSMTFLKRGFL
jgi:hypothetical protein